MRYRFRIIRTQTAERVVRASDEHAALDKLRAELALPYGFLGRWEDCALELELVDVEIDFRTRSEGVDGGPLLLSVKDAATHLGISRGMMYELLNRDDIESLRIGQRRLISREALNRFIETNSRPAPR